MLNTTTNNYPHILTLNNAQLQLGREGKAATRMLMKGHAASMESAVQKSREPKVEGPGERDAGRLRSGAGGGSCGFFELKSSIPVG